MSTDDKKAGCPLEFSGKTKGKRSKLSQRRPASQRDPAGGEEAGNEDGLLINNENNDGDGVAEEAGVQQNIKNHHNQSNNIFNQVGSDPMGLNTMSLDSSPDGGLMHQGSPTLLSALKGSSLRASAYGQDFSTSFKDDDMSLLGDFKNAAARFSLNALGVNNDGLTGEGDLGSDSLWSSFPVDVDSLLPSRTPVPYGDPPYSGAMAHYDMEGMGGDDRGQGQGQGQVGPSGANGNENDSRGHRGRMGGGAGVEDSEMLRSSSTYQYFFPMQYGDAHGNGNGNGGHPSISNGGSMFDSSYGGAYGIGMQQQQQHDSGGGGVQMGPGGHINGTGGAGPGPGQMQQMQIPMQPNGQLAFNGQQQQQQQGMLPQQMRPMRYFVPGGQGQQQMGYMQMPYQQQQQPMQGGMMIQQPYQYTVMVQPGQQQQGQELGKGAGAGADSGGQGAKGGKRQIAANNQKTDDMRKASRGNEHNSMQQPADMGGAGMSAPPGVMMAGQMLSVDPTDPYGVQPMQAMQRMRSSGSGSKEVVYQQHHQHMMMQQPGPRMYSASSSVSTNGSGNAMGPGGGGPGGPGGPMGGGHMMIPPYILNQMPMGAGLGSNGPIGQIQPVVGNAQGGMGVDEAGLAELETIVAKLDKSTRSNIKETLYRLARSARNRGARNGDGGAQGQPPPVVDKAKSLVDKCVANLLYHRYTDMPTQGTNMQRNGQQQVNNNNNNNHGDNDVDDDDDGSGLTAADRKRGVASQRICGLEPHPHGAEQQQRSVMARPNSMANVIQGRHGSA